MLSPTQLRPMTTVSAVRLPIHWFAFSRALPPIVHPQPEFRTGNDAPRDHVVDPLRQRHRVSLFLTQLVDTNRPLEFEAMPGSVRYAKSEHNRRAMMEGQARGRWCRPRRTSHEAHENALSGNDGLIRKKHDHGLFRQCFHEKSGGIPAIDYLGAGAGARRDEIALEILVIEPSRDRADPGDEGHHRQPRRLPSSVVRADHDDTLVQRFRFAERLQVHVLDGAVDLVDRKLLKADVAQSLPPKMPPAFIESLA